MSNILTITNVTRIYDEGSINEKHALNGINLHMDESDFVTVIGGNGAGKSTLLNCIAGVFFANTGNIIIDGIDVTKQPEHVRAKYLGRVFQDTKMGTASKMSIEQNLAMAYRRGRTPGFKLGLPKNSTNIYKEHLKILDLGLENRVRTQTGYLSGGQRQALTLLMATIQKPKILLLDEHTASLDPKTAKKVLELTEKIISEDKLTALMVTHNMKDALKYGNRTIMMHNGRIILDISGKEKQNLTVNDLLEMFEKASGDNIASDRMLLN